MAFAGWLGSLPCAASANVQPHPVTADAVLCRTLHSAVQPALTELMKNDTLLEAANRAFAKAGGDRIFLRNAANALTRSLNTISQLLGDGFPQDADAATQASEALMKSSLQAVASAQNDALNLIEGFLQTEDMGRARVEGVQSVDPRTPYIDFAGVPGNMPYAPAGSRDRAGSPVELLQMTRTRISSLEEPAGTAIMSAAQVCNSR